MEMSLFKREGKTFTKFKVTLKSFYKGWYFVLNFVYGIDVSKPVKKNSRYIYFEKEGDWINGKM